MTGLLCSGNEAHRRWKVLKSEYKEGVQEVEALISTLQDRMDKLHHKRDRLTNLVIALEKKVYTHTLMMHTHGHTHFSLYGDYGYFVLVLCHVLDV